jgi:hypothetical protein
MGGIGGFTLSSYVDSGKHPNLVNFGNDENRENPILELHLNTDLRALFSSDPLSRSMQCPTTEKQCRTTALDDDDLGKNLCNWKLKEAFL